MATKETTHKARAEAYAQKIIGKRGDEVLGTSDDSIGLSFVWAAVLGVPVTPDPHPHKSRHVIHVWEDANGIVVKTEVKNRGYGEK